MRGVVRVAVPEAEEAEAPRIGLTLGAQVVLRRDLEPHARRARLGVREREHDARVAFLAQEGATTLERIGRRRGLRDVLEEDGIEADDRSLGRSQGRAHSPRCRATTSGLAMSAPACRFFTRPSGPVTRK